MAKVNQTTGEDGAQVLIQDSTGHWIIRPFDRYGMATALRWPNEYIVYGEHVRNHVT
jgi:hypothetical protein